MASARARNDLELHGKVLEGWLATFGSLNTRAAYRSDLDAFKRWCASNSALPLRVDTHAVAAFQAARAAAGDSQATLQRRWSALSSFYQFAIDNAAIVSNPVEGVPRPKGEPGTAPTPLLTADAVDRYLAIAAGLDPRLEALVALLALDGLKLGEALALDVADVTGRPPKVTLVVRRAGTARRVMLRSHTAQAVHRCASRRAEQPLFTSAQPGGDRSPRRLTRFGADHLIRQLSPAGQARVTANELRRFHFSVRDQRG